MSRTGEAFGHPGIQPRWTHGGKDGVGTAYSASSRLWFTLWNGIVTEVYYPYVDRPQARDLQYLVTDGTSFFHEEKRHLKPELERLSDHALGYRAKNSDPEGRYTIIKESIVDSLLPCFLQRTRLTGDQSVISKLHLYALCAPHLEVGGGGNGQGCGIAAIANAAREIDQYQSEECQIIPSAQSSLAVRSSR